MLNFHKYEMKDEVVLRKEEVPKLENEANHASLGILRFLNREWRMICFLGQSVSVNYCD